VINAAKGRDDFITVDGIETLLANIGAEKKVSRKDVEIILSEVGESDSSPTIHIDQMMRILWEFVFVMHVLSGYITFVHSHCIIEDEAYDTVFKPVVLSLIK